MKDEKAAALFGLKAMNGVIIVTLKRQIITIKDDETGEGIQNATVIIHLQKKVLRFVADSNGAVQLTQENFRVIKRIEVSSVGYKSIVLEAQPDTPAPPVIVRLTRENVPLKEVVIVGYNYRGCRSSCSCCVKWTRVYPDSKIYQPALLRQSLFIPTRYKKKGN